METTESVVDRGNYADSEEDAIHDWSATGNREEEVSDYKRCIHNCEDGRTMFGAQSLTCIDNQGNCSSYRIRHVREFGEIPSPI